MILSDTAIEAARTAGEITFRDEDGELLALDDWQLQPVSVDLRLGDLVGWSSRWNDGGPWEWRLAPGKFALGSTVEAVEVSHTLAGFAAGKSSVARRGIQVEAAGLVDPGFQGQLTLEIVNFSDEPVMLVEGEPICQMYFMRVLGPVARPYGSAGLRSRYQGQMGPTPPR